MVIGITGGTGSGKTSALQALEALGGTDIGLRCRISSGPAGGRSPAQPHPGRLWRGVPGNGTGPAEAGESRLFRSAGTGAAQRHHFSTISPACCGRRMEGKVLVGLDAINLMESGLGELCCRTGRCWPPASSGFSGSCSGIISRRSTHGCVFRPRSRTAIIVSTAQMCWKIRRRRRRRSGRRRRFFFRDLLRQLHHITEGGHER